jgi:hypothetical protein
MRPLMSLMSLIRALGGGWTIHSRANEGQTTQFTGPGE